MISGIQAIILTCRESWVRTEKKIRRGSHTHSEALRRKRENAPLKSETLILDVSFGQYTKGVILFLHYNLVNPIHLRLYVIHIPDNFRYVLGVNLLNPFKVIHFPEQEVNPLPERCRAEVRELPEVPFFPAREPP